MNIIFFSIFLLRRRIVAINVFFMPHLDWVRVGSLNVGSVTGMGKELGGYDGNEKGWSIVCV